MAGYGFTNSGIRSTSIETADIAVIVLYFAGTFAVGIYTIVKAKTNIKDFFLAGRSMTWWPVGMSLFASNIGSVNFLGIAGSGAASGLAVVSFEWSAVFLLVLLGWVFLPVYIASGIYTMPEYLHWRFGGERIRIYLSVVSLVTYMIAVAAADLYSGSVFIQQTIGWSILGSALFLLAVSFSFTALGGLETVILTDAVAVVIMVIGGLVLCVVGFVKVGGFTNLEFQYMRAVSNHTLANLGNSTCGVPRDDAWHIFRDVWWSDYPWLGTILRTTLGSLWYWCANQYLVQRALAAKSITHAKAGCILAGYLKLLPMFIMVLPGMMSRTLYPNEVACADPVTCAEVCDNPVGCSNIALPKLVMELLPIGVRGFLISAMMAAVISSLTSIFNSSSALFTMDLWIRGRPKATERELLFVGRLFVVVLVAVAIALIPVMQQANGGEIFKYATTINGLLGAPTCAMFLLAMFWKRCNEKGAFWGMLIAQLWGVTRFILDFIYPAPPCGTADTRPGILRNFHVFYHTISQIVLAFLVAFVVSVLTDKVTKEQLKGLTFWTRYEKPARDVVAEKEHAERLLTLAEEKAHDNPDSGENLSPDKTGPDDKSTPEISINGSQFPKDVEVKRPKHIAVWERFINGLCGSKERSQNEDTQYEILEEHAVRVASIQQTPFWRNFMNINALVLCGVTIFLYGFFH